MSEIWKEQVRRILNVMLYIQENLDEKLSLEELARIAYISPYHFHRLFRAYTGESLHQYVTRLRLEAAAGRIVVTQKTITEIGLDVGYETPSSFTKAFRKYMGVSPVEFRRRFLDEQENQPNIGKEMEVEFIQGKDLSLYFIRATGSYSNSAEEAWIKMDHYIKDHNLDRGALRYFGIGHDNPDITEADKVRFDACILSEQKLDQEELTGKQTVPGGEYAVFTHKGPHHELEYAYDYIYRDWLPKSGRTLGNRPFFFEYITNPMDVSIEEKECMTKVYVALES